MVENYEQLLKILLDAVEAAKNKQGSTQTTPCNNAIPVGVSNRHIHLSQRDMDVLFGANYALTPTKDLGQPGQFACKESVTICGPKGAMEKIRILGPVRKDTQVELLAADCFKLGIPAMLRMSGDLAGTPGLTIIGPKGSVQLPYGAIVAQRHIHMHTQDARRLGYHDGQVVKIALDSPRGGTYDHVVIRSNDQSALECHIDIEEGNAMQVNSNTSARIV